MRGAERGRREDARMWQRARRGRGRAVWTRTGRKAIARVGGSGEGGHSGKGGGPSSGPDTNHSQGYTCESGSVVPIVVI